MEYQVRVTTGHYNWLAPEEKQNSVYIKTPEHSFSLMIDLDKSDHLNDFDGAWAQLAKEACELWLSTIWVSSTKETVQSFLEWLKVRANRDSLDLAYIELERKKLISQQERIESELKRLNNYEEEVA